MSTARRIEATIPAAAVAPETPGAEAAGPSFPLPRTWPWTYLTLPVACGIALVLHVLESKGELPVDTQTYTTFLLLLLGSAAATSIAMPFLPRFKRWVQVRVALFATGLGLLCAWEAITAGFRLLPMPYFPSPAGVLQNFINDRALLLDSTWHSLVLLLSGYVVGALVGLVTGVLIGWSKRVRYWGMPMLKTLGPIPATAWIPLAMVLAPNSTISAIGLIALAVWFPVSMLTASGIWNTRSSFLDVARTLGAGRAYLIFRVAIPAAMPNIFVGLFMGLGASFLTLVVAETVGVRSGLGWYVTWAQGWAEYGKVFAALFIMAVFFSTIMNLLFKLRDHVLVWQKGMIRW